MVCFYVILFILEIQEPKKKQSDNFWYQRDKTRRIPRFCKWGTKMHPALKVCLIKIFLKNVLHLLGGHEM